MTARPVFACLTAVGVAGALVLGTLETDPARSYWQDRPGLEDSGPLLLGLALLALLVGTVGGVVAQVRLRRTPAVDGRSAWRRGAAWTGWVLLGAAAAFSVVCAACVLGVVVLDRGGCSGGQMCGLATALVAYGTGVVASVLAAAGGALWWLSRPRPGSAATWGPG